MAESTVILALVLFGGIPAGLLGLLINRYGKRHGWGPTQYAWTMLWGGLGWFTLFMWFIKGEINIILWTVAKIGVPWSLVIIGLTRTQRSKSGNKTRETVLWVLGAFMAFSVLIAIETVLYRPLK
jgi:hypothetical protein